MAPSKGFKRFFEGLVEVDENMSRTVFGTSPGHLETVLRHLVMLPFVLSFPKICLLQTKSGVEA